MAANGWFETVAEAQRRAKKRLPKSVYMALVAGSERGTTLEDNLDAFSELGFAPHVANLAFERDLSVKVLGQELALPVMISPTGVQAVHPDGEIAIARAAAARGTAMGLSSFASKPVEEVVASGAPTFFQLYWSGSKEQILARVRRAEAAGIAGVIVTLDWSFSHGRDWGSPNIPSAIDFRTMLKFAPEVALRPQWALRWARSGALPDLTAPNMALPGQPAPGFFEAYGEWMQTPLPTWDDLAWLREQYPGTLVLKGVMRVDDAQDAVRVGFDALSVSNHGGNNLDGTPASIRALPAVAEAVGDRIDVLLDGGIRRGSDVVKAVALGAKAVMIGRAYLWGLAANGQAGVENVLDILRSGIDSGVLGIGKRRVADLTAEDLLVPDGFVRRLGADRGA